MKADHRRMAQPRYSYRDVEAVKLELWRPISTVQVCDL